MYVVISTLSRRYNLVRLITVNLIVWQLGRLPTKLVFSDLLKPQP